MYPVLDVLCQGELVGNLSFREPGTCDFSYNTEWAKTRFPISPCIPLRGPVESSTVIRFLKNLFPEGNAFDLLLKSESLSKNNLYAILRTIGKDTAGALSFVTDNSKKEATYLRPITDKELIEKLNTGSTRELVTWDGKYRLSVAGIQNKLNVFLKDNEQIMLADGSYSSTHILKFSSNEYKDIVINELVCMHFAKSIGINCANVELKSFGDHIALLVERFDRKQFDGGVKKRHIIDSCQALDLSPDSKYERNFGSSRDVKDIREGVTLPKLFEFTKECSVPAMVTRDIIDWTIFNLIIGNSDAHGKNISFFIEHNGISITPFYDLVSITHEAKENNNLDTSLAMAVGDNFDIDNIKAYDLLCLAEEASIPTRLLKNKLQRITTIARSKLHTLSFEQYELDEGNMALIESLKDEFLMRIKKLDEQSHLIDKVTKTAL